MLHILAIGLLPDTLLTPLSLGLMWMTLRWLSKDQFSTGDWIFTGILFGLAGLSKYTAAFTAIAFVLVLLSSPRKAWLTKVGFWLALVIALLLITPVLYWNWVNDWISFKYQLAHGGGGEWLWRRLAAYTSIQILVFGPLFIFGCVVFLKDSMHASKISLLALLGFFAIPFAVFTGLSGGGGLPHWTSPAWFCLAPFAGIGLAKAWATQHRKWIRFFLITQIVLCCIGFGYVLSGGIGSASIKSNPIADLYGWKLAGQKSAALTKATKADGIAVQNWTLGSRAAWYASPTPVFVLDHRQDQFDLWFGELPIGATVLLIQWSEMPHAKPIGEKSSFETCEAIDSLEIKRFGRILSKFDFSLCSNWQGPN
nr:glycosyltransferase family 39 protein [Polynucleobacter necessarius]